LIRRFTPWGFLEHCHDFPPITGSSGCTKSSRWARIWCAISPKRPRS